MISKIKFTLWLWAHGWSHKKLNEVKENLLQQLDLPKPNKHPWCIGMMGVIGAGKTTVANAVGKELKIPVLTSDEVRRELERRNAPLEKLEPMALHVCVMAFKDLLARKIPMILDADVNLPTARDLVDPHVEAAGYEMIFVRVEMQNLLQYNH